MSDEFTPNHIKWFIVKDKKYVNPESLVDPTTGEEIKDPKIIRRKSPDFIEKIIGDKDDKITVVAMPVLEIDGREVALPECIAASDIRFIEIIEGEATPEDPKFSIKFIEPNPKDGNATVQQDTEWEFKINVKNLTPEDAELKVIIERLDKSGEKPKAIAPLTIKAGTDRIIPLEYKFPKETFETGLYSFKALLFQKITLGKDKISEDELKIELIENSGTKPTEKIKPILIIRDQKGDIKYNIENDQEIKLKQNLIYGFTVKINKPALKDEYIAKLIDLTAKKDLADIEIDQEITLGFKNNNKFGILLINKSSGKIEGKLEITVNILKESKEVTDIEDIKFVKPALSSEEIIIEIDKPYPLEFELNGTPNDELQYLVYVNETPDENETLKQKKHILGKYNTLTGNTIIFKSSYFKPDEKYFIYIILTNKDGEILKSKDGNTIDDNIIIETKERELEPEESDKIKDHFLQAFEINGKSLEIKGEAKPHQKNLIELNKGKEHAFITGLIDINSLKKNKKQFEKSFEFLWQESISTGEIKTFRTKDLAEPSILKAEANFNGEVSITLLSKKEKRIISGIESEEKPLSTITFTVKVEEESEEIPIICSIDVKDQDGKILTTLNNNDRFGIEAFKKYKVCLTTDNEKVLSEPNRYNIGYQTVIIDHTKKSKIGSQGLLEYNEDFKLPENFTGIIKAILIDKTNSETISGIKIALITKAESTEIPEHKLQIWSIDSESNPDERLEEIYAGTARTITLERDIPYWLFTTIKDEIDIKKKYNIIWSENVTSNTTKEYNEKNLKNPQGLNITPIKTGEIVVELYDKGTHDLKSKIRVKIIIKSEEEEKPFIILKYQDGDTIGKYEEDNDILVDASRYIEIIPDLTPEEAKENYRYIIGDYRPGERTISYPLERPTRLNLNPNQKLAAKITFINEKTNLTTVIILNLTAKETSSTIYFVSPIDDKRISGKTFAIELNKEINIKWKTNATEGSIIYRTIMLASSGEKVLTINTIKDITKNTEVETFTEEDFDPVINKTAIHLQLLDKASKVISEDKILFTQKELEITETEKTESIDSLEILQPSKIKHIYEVGLNVERRFITKIHGTHQEGYNYLVYINETPNENDPLKQKRHILEKYPNALWTNQDLTSNLIKGSINFTEDYYKEGETYELCILALSKEDKILVNKKGKPIIDSVTIKIAKIQQRLIFEDVSTGEKKEFESNSQITLETEKDYKFTTTLEINGHESTLSSVKWNENVETGNERIHGPKSINPTFELYSQNPLEITPEKTNNNGFITCTILDETLQVLSEIRLQVLVIAKHLEKESVLKVKIGTETETLAENITSKNKGSVTLFKNKKYFARQTEDPKNLILRWTILDKQNNIIGTYAQEEKVVFTGEGGYRIPKSTKKSRLEITDLIPNQNELIIEPKILKKDPTKITLEVYEPGILFKERIDIDVSIRDDELFVKFIEPKSEDGILAVKYNEELAFKTQVRNLTTKPAKLELKIIPLTLEGTTIPEESKELSRPQLVKEDTDTITQGKFILSENFKEGEYIIELKLSQQHIFGEQKSEDKIRIRLFGKTAFDNAKPYVQIIDTTTQEINTFEKDDTVKLIQNREYALIGNINGEEIIKQGYIYKILDKDNNQLTENLNLGEPITRQFNNNEEITFNFINLDTKEGYEITLNIEVQSEKPEVIIQEITQKPNPERYFVKKDEVIKLDINKEYRFATIYNPKKGQKIVWGLIEQSYEKEGIIEKNKTIEQRYKDIVDTYGLTLVEKQMIEKVPYKGTGYVSCNIFDKENKIISSTIIEIVTDENPETGLKKPVIIIKDLDDPKKPIILSTNQDQEFPLKQGKKYEISTIKGNYTIQWKDTLNEKITLKIDESYLTSPTKVGDAYINCRYIFGPQKQTETIIRVNIIPANFKPEIKQKLIIYDKNRNPIEVITENTKTLFLESGDYILEPGIETDRETYRRINIQRMFSHIALTVEKENQTEELEVELFKKIRIKINNNGQIRSKLYDENNLPISEINVDVVALIPEKPLGEKAIYFIDPETKEKVSEKTFEVKENQEYPFAYRITTNGGTVLYTRFKVLPNLKPETFSQGYDELTTNEKEFTTTFTKDDFDPQERMNIMQIELQNENHEVIGTDRVFIKLISEPPKTPFLAFIENGKVISESTKEVNLEYSELTKSNIVNLKLDWNTNIDEYSYPKHSFEITFTKLNQNLPEEIIKDKIIQNLSDRSAEFYLLEEDFPVSTKTIKAEIKLINFEKEITDKNLKDTIFLKLIGEKESPNPTISITEVEDKPRLIIKTNRNTSIDLETNKKYQINHYEKLKEGETIIWDHTVNSKDVKKDTNKYLEVTPSRKGPASILCTKVKNNEIIGKTRIDIKLTSNEIPPERALTTRPIIEVIKENPDGEKVYIGPIPENTTVSFEPNTRYFLTTGRQRPEALVRWIDNLENKNPVIEEALGISRKTTKLSDRVLTAEIIDKVTNEVVGRTTVQVKVEPKALSEAPKPKLLGPAQPEKEAEFKTKQGQDYLDNIQLEIGKPVNSNNTYIYKERENIIFKCKVKKDPERKVRYLHWYIQEQNPSAKEGYSPFDFKKPFRFGISELKDENVATTSFETTEWYMKKIPLRAYQPYSIIVIATDDKQKPILRTNNEVIQDVIAIEYQPDINPELKIDVLNLSKEETNEISKDYSLNLELQIKNDQKTKLDKITWYLLSKEDEEFSTPKAILQMEDLSEFEGKPFETTIPNSKLNQIKLNTKYILRGIGQYSNNEFIKLPNNEFVTINIPIRAVENIENYFIINSKGKKVKILVPKISRQKIKTIFEKLTPEEKTMLDQLIEINQDLEEIEVKYKP